MKKLKNTVLLMYIPEYRLLDPGRSFTLKIYGRAVQPISKFRKLTAELLLTLYFINKKLSKYLAV